MFTIRALLEPHARGVIGTLTVTTLQMSESDLGAFLIGLTEVATKTPGLEATWTLLDHQSGQVLLSSTTPWDDVCDHMVEVLDPAAEQLPFPIPTYLETRVKSISHSATHWFFEIALSYRGVWSTTRSTNAWTN